MPAYKYRKATQRAFNKIIRNTNESIEKDTLWRGRFVLLQRTESWFNYSDGSGGTLFVYLRAYDKKTKKYEDYFIDYYKGQNIAWELNMNILNSFIVEDLNVWLTEKPYEDKTDYTKIKIPEDISSYPFNWHYPHTIEEMMEE